LARAACQQQAYARAVALADEAVTHAAAVGDAWALAMAVGMRGTSFLCAGEVARARSDLERSVGLSRQIGERHNLAWALTFLGGVELTDGRLSAAEAAL